MSLLVVGLLLAAAALLGDGSDLAQQALVLGVLLAAAEVLGVINIFARYQSSLLSLTSILLYIRPALLVLLVPL